MEEVKNEILTLTKELTKNLSKTETEYLDILEKIKEKVKELNNEQIQKKYNGIEYFILNEDITLEDNFNKALKYIEYFEKSVEKNYLKDNGEMLPTIDKFKKAIENKNSEEIFICSQEFIQYMKTLKDLDKVKAINNKLAPILSQLSKKDIKDLTDDEIKDFLIQTNELSDIINDKVEIRVKDKKDIPEDLTAIRKEMDEILGKSLFEGIENEYEFAIAYQLDEHEVEKFQALRSELKEMLADSIANKVRIDEIRIEMFIILGVDPYTYKDNKKLIDNLEEPNKTRFAELKAKHDELLEKKNRKTTPTPEKTEGTGKKDDGTGKTKPTGLVPVTKTPTPTPEPEKKKGRLVKFAKSAKEFYKRHKKAILITTGIVLAAIALPHVLPSVMYFNSVLWQKAILANTSSVLPTALHDINLILGKFIGATFTEASGIWTLANGTILNATAAQTGILAALTKVGLSAGTVGIGTTIAFKNACKLAKEKIEKFKNREKKPKAKEDKENIFTNVKDSFKKGFEKGKSKVAEEWNKRTGDKKDPEPPKNPTEPKNENRKFQRKDVSDRINRIVNYLIDKKVISEKEKEELEKADGKTFMIKFKDIFNRYNIDSVKKDNNKEKVEFNRSDINFAVSEFIKYCYETGVYNDEDIKKINELDPIAVRDLVYADPRFTEFEKMRTEWSSTKEETTPEVVVEEKGKGTK